MQREDEADLWYSRFKGFLLRGPSRTVLAGVQEWRREKGKKEISSIPNSWTLAKKRNDWLKRASLFDEAVDEIKNDVWSVRQAEIIDIEWDMVERLKKKFEKMDAFPLQAVTKDTRKSGTNVIERTVIRPLKWTAANMVQIARAISELGRSSAGLPTVQTDLTSDGEKIVFYIPSNSREKKTVTDKEENAESDN
jgi:hypothetical protein